jgi:TatD DNase family protein
MFIDSHCHLDCIDLKDFDHSFEKLLDDIKSQQVTRMLCVSINLESYHPMRELVDPYDFIDVSVGNHPSDAAQHVCSSEILQELGQDKRVVAIGETGLDYYYAKESQSEQQLSFCSHIQAARALNKPVIIHTRDAQEDTLEIMKSEQVSDCGGVLHCFTESWEMAKAALDMGLYISFSGIVTFKNAQALREVAKKVPDDRFLIETDSPYLAPMPHRGKQNRPSWVKHVAECLADVRSGSIEDIADLSRINYERLFKQG